MKTKFNVSKKLMFFVAAFAVLATVFTNPVNVNAALAAPTNIEQTGADNTSIEGSFTAVDNAYQYLVQISTSNAFPADSTNTKTVYDSKFTFYNLAAGTTYYVRVCSCTSSNVSTAGTWSAPVEVATAPAKVASISQIDATATTATITWPAVAGATRYSVYIAAPSDTQYTPVGDTNATSYTLSIPANATYYVSVISIRDIHSVGKAAALTSYLTEKKIVTAPSAPKGLQVAGGSPSSKYLRYYWETSSTPNNTDGYEIIVYKLTTKGKAKKLKSTTKESTYTSNGVNYSYVDIYSSSLFKYPTKFKVRTYKTIDGGKKVYSPWSGEKIYVPQAKQKSLKSTYRNKKTATLKWDKVAGATSYTIYYKTTENGKWKVIKKNVKGTSATVKYNYYGRSYYYVKANKVKFGKKKLNSAGPNNAAYWQYWF